ncbi:MAG: DUF6935 domain-containing protein [Candidatus Helarchaeota archaeon]
MGFLDRIGREVQRGLQRHQKDIVKGLKAIKMKACKETYQLKHIDNFEEFKKQFEEKGSDPRWTVFFYMMGVLEYITGDKKQGEPMITLTIKKDYMQKDPVSPSGLKLPQAGEGYFVQHMLESPNIVKSYFGGTPDNNYEIDKENLKMIVVGKNIDDKKKHAVIDVQSGGKDIYSRVKLQKNRHGIWKLYSTSSMATGVKKTSDEVDDF